MTSGPEYWPRAKRALARRDPVLALIIRAHPRIALQSRGDPFKTLARSIVGQQISVKAAQSIWDRLAAVAPDLSPHAVHKLRLSRLRAVGLSMRKAEYVRDLARHFVDGTLHVHRWPKMDDEAVIDELIAVRGIGRWTAEMFLMFNLLRPDVLPADDLGLRKAVFRHYVGGDGLAETGVVRKVGEEWRPWRTVGTWYMWRSLNPVPVKH